MSMYTPPSASLDAARRLLHGQRRMFDSAFSNASTVTLIDGAFPMRTRRNISELALKRPQHTDGSSSTSIATRAVLNDRRWPTRNGALLAATPSSRRGLQRPTRKPPVKPTTNTSTANKQAGNASGKSEVDLDSPHRMSAHGLSGGNALAKLNAQLEEAQRQHVLCRKSLEDKKEALRHAEAEHADTKREYEAKFQNVYGAAYVRARKDLMREMQAEVAATAESLENARRHEQKSAEATKALETAQAQLEETHRRQTRERTNELERAKARAEDKAKQEARERMQHNEAKREAMFAEEMRKLHTDGESRRLERGSYDSYRLLWRQLDEDVGALSNYLKALQRLSKEKVTFWQVTRDNFQPESIEAWFPQRYPKLTERFRSLIENKLKAAEQSSATLQNRREDLEEVEKDARSSAHISRALTRHHHFEEDYTATRSISVCREMLNENPLAMRRNKLVREAADVERQIALMPPGTRRELLEQSRMAILRDTSAIGALTTFYQNQREAETFKEVSRSSHRVQEVFMRSWEVEGLIAQADRTRAGYQKEKGDEEDEWARKERDAFDETRSHVHTERSRLERSMSMRQLLEESLPESVNQTDQTSYTEQLAQMQAKVESDARTRLREVTVSKRATGATTASRPIAPPSRVAAPVRSQSPAEQTPLTFGRQMKAKMASATSSKAREHPKASLQNHNDQYAKWQDQCRSARRAQAAETGKEGEVTEERQRTRQADDVDATVTDVSGIRAESDQLAPVTIRKTPLAKNSKRAIRRMRTSLISRASGRVPRTAFETQTGAAAGAKFEPTGAKKAAHVCWPTFSPRSLVEYSRRSLERRMTTASAQTMGGANTTLDQAAETAEALDQWQLCSSRSSWSSYEPSEHSEAESPQSQPADDGGSEGPTNEDLSHLNYHMSKTDHRNAVMASPNTAAAYWTYKLYKNSEGRPPPVYYCTNLEQAETRAKEFLDEPVIGFDIEWEIRHTPGRSGIKKNVSLIQIAADDKIALFHIAVFKGETIEELMPESLHKILESRDVVKAGVNIQGDASRMEACLNVKMTGIFELSHLYKVVTLSDTPDLINRRPFKLADQVQDVLLLPLKKDAVRTSAWSKRLDMQQTEYAASDAYAGFRLYHALEAKRKVMDPMPPRPAFWEEHKPIQLGDGTLIQARTRKKATTTSGKKAADAEEEDEDEEFFDAVETLDAYDLAVDSAKSAGVPLAGLSIMYPDLPTIEDQLGASLSGLTISHTTGDKSPQEKATKRAGPPQSAEVEQAEQWVTQWRASRPEEYVVKASQAQLRAYALWHQQGLKCKDVAVLLRGTPLALQTVATYVLEAVRQENLEYDGDNVRDALNILPSSVHRRYGKVVDEVGK